MSTKDSKTEQPCTLQNVTDSTFDEIFRQIELAFKTGTVDLCPSCGRITQVHSNPMYYHECEHCKWQGDYRDCKMKTTKDFVREIIAKYWR